ncbi:hypothetical protein AB0939_15655 [Streptomyces sp. NPDC006990]
MPDCATTDPQNNRRRGGDDMTRNVAVRWAALAPLATLDVVLFLLWR